MGRLQELPRDVLLVILHKLATRQGPHTLLRATFACKALGPAAESAPSFWKAAFFFPSVVEQFCEEDLKALDAEVETVGGYKRLLAARLQVSGLSNKRRQREGN